MSAILPGTKLPVGRRASAYLVAEESPWLAQATRRPRGHEERLFRPSGGGYDRHMPCRKTLLQMIEYLSQNPLQPGLVERFLPMA